MRKSGSEGRRSGRYRHALRRYRCRQTVEHVVITSDDIRNSPARTLPQLLSYQAGLEATTYSGKCIASDGRHCADSAPPQHRTHWYYLTQKIERHRPVGCAVVGIATGFNRARRNHSRSGAVQYGDGAVGGVIKHHHAQARQERPAGKP